MHKPPGHFFWPLNHQENQCLKVGCDDCNRNIQTGVCEKRLYTNTAFDKCTPVVFVFVDSIQACYVLT